MNTNITDTISTSLFWAFCLAALVINGLVIARSIITHYGIGITILLISTVNFINFVCFSMLWLCCTILSPLKNHVPACLEAWALISLLPSLLFLRNCNAKINVETLIKKKIEEEKLEKESLETHQ